MSCKECNNPKVMEGEDLCWECFEKKIEKENAEHIKSLHAQVTETKPYGLIGRECGRDFDAWIDLFEKLEDAIAFVKDRWQGEDYIDGPQGFHTDYSTYELIGFKISDVQKELA